MGSQLIRPHGNTTKTIIVMKKTKKNKNREAQKKRSSPSHKVHGISGEAGRNSMVGQIWGRGRFWAGGERMSIIRNILRQEITDYRRKINDNWRVYCPIQWKTFDDREVDESNVVYGCWYINKGKGKGCRTPSCMSVARRWITRVCDAWPVRRHTYGYLPNRRVLPLPLGRYILHRAGHANTKFGFCLKYGLIRMEWLSSLVQVLNLTSMDYVQDFFACRSRFRVREALKKLSTSKWYNTARQTNVFLLFSI